MKTYSKPQSILPLALAYAMCCGTTIQAAEPDPQEAAIHKVAQGFVEAFHKGDAKSVAAFWAPDGDYVDLGGRVFNGRKAIEQTFTELFKGSKGLRLRIEVASLRFPSAELAIEDGTTAVIPPDGSAPSRARYTNIFVKKDGQWLLSSVREAPDSGPSNYEFLRGLEWVIGEWVDDVSGGAVAGEVGHVSFDWAPGENFIVSTRTVDFKDASHLQSTQWIGWDAAMKKIRSWSFQADGGVSESTWTKDGDKWLIKSESVLASGSKVTSTSVAGSANGTILTWQSKDQKLDGKALPDTKEVKMKRVR
jgi:uncharacterized protein (TIGR02246 family)